MSGRCTGGGISLGDVLLQTAAVGPVPSHLLSVGLVKDVLERTLCHPASWHWSGRWLHRCAVHIMAGGVLSPPA